MGTHKPRRISRPINENGSFPIDKPAGKWGRPGEDRPAYTGKPHFDDEEESQPGTERCPYEYDDYEPRYSKTGSLTERRARTMSPLLRESFERVARQSLRERARPLRESASSIKSVVEQVLSDRNYEVDAIDLGEQMLMYISSIAEDWSASRDHVEEYVDKWCDFFYLEDITDDEIDALIDAAGGESKPAARPVSRISMPRRD